MENQLAKQLESGEAEGDLSMEAHESYEKSFKTVNRGDYLDGKVVKIQDDGVYVDIGYKQEGFVPMNQLSHNAISHPSEAVKIGQEIPLVVLKSSDMEGELILSKKRAELEYAWRNVIRAYETGDVVDATVVEAVKGGLLVDLGLRGFVPASQIDLRPVKDLTEYVGEALKFKVIELDRARRKVVLSRKKVLEEERVRMKSETLSNLYEGLIVKGTVARLTNFGAFINLGGVDGLVHISEMSWKRIKHPSEALSVGQVVDVLVLKVDAKKERISLSVRQALPDPWSMIDKKIAVNQVIKGTVTKIAKNYIFVEVEDGVEGVIPINEVSEEKNIKPEDLVKEGQEINVKVLDIKKDTRRMLLSLKQASGESTKEEVKKYTDSSHSESSGATIGEIMMAKMKAAGKPETVPQEKEVKPSVQAVPHERSKTTDVKEQDKGIEKAEAPVVAPTATEPVVVPVSSEELKNKEEKVEAEKPEKK